MPSSVLAFIIALVIVLLITPVIIKFAIKTGAMDAPDKRKVHHQPIPRLGGLGIYIINTSKGVMNEKEDSKAGVGGEVLCNVW